MKKLLSLSITGMELRPDKVTVRLNAESTTALSFGDKVSGEVSILQLAKIFGTDKDLATMLVSGFGSRELEEKCDETRDYVSKFPDVSLWPIEVAFNSISIETEKGFVSSGSFEIVTYPLKNKDTIEIYSDDISGWENEGLRLTLPLKLYENTIKGNEKHLKIVMSPFALYFYSDEE